MATAYKTDEFPVMRRSLLAAVETPALKPAAVWTDQPEARVAIMAMVAAGARPTVHFTAYALTRDEQRLYTGEVAAMIGAAREAWLVEQGGGEDTTRYMELHFTQPTVAQAIDRAASDPSIIAGWLNDALIRAEEAQAAMNAECSPATPDSDAATFAAIEDRWTDQRDQFAAMIAAVTRVDPARLVGVLA